MQLTYDVRTPLGAIIGFFELLTEAGVSQEEQLDLLSKVHRASRYLLGVINDLLDFCKLELGKVELPLTPGPSPRAAWRGEHANG